MFLFAKTIFRDEIEIRIEISLPFIKAIEDLGIEAGLVNVDVYQSTDMVNDGRGPLIHIAMHRPGSPLQIVTYGN